MEPIILITKIDAMVATKLADKWYGGERPQTAQKILMLVTYWTKKTDLAPQNNILQISRDKIR